MRSFSDAGYGIPAALSFAIRNFRSAFSTPPANHNPVERKIKRGMNVTSTRFQGLSQRRGTAAAFISSRLAHASLSHGTRRSGSIRTLTIPGPAGRLEAVLNDGAADAPLAALVCHPHPLFGGSLHNKVVYHAMRALNDPHWGLGLPVLRFNFRGVGLSQGIHDGEAETGDVLAALDWIAHEFQRPILLAGFSFGAAMALRACWSLDHEAPGQPHPAIHALIALGLPTQPLTSAYHYSFLQGLTMPKLFLSGDRDQFAPPDQLSQVVSQAAEPRRLILFHGADHFFVGQLEPMQRAIARWSKEQLP